jgi:hypothetical protein
MLPLSYQFSGATLPEAHLGKGGGLVGWALSEPLLDFFGSFLSNGFYLLLLAYGVSLMAGFTWDDFLTGLNTLSVRLRQLSQELAPPEPAPRPTTQPERAAQLPLPAPPPAPNPDDLVIIDDTAVYTDPAKRSKRLPPLTLLEEGSDITLTPEEIDEKKRIIEETLNPELPAETLAVRMGLHTGEVIGKRFGDDPRVIYMAVGNSMQFAANLQACAAPGSVLVSEVTYSLVQEAAHAEVVGLIAGNRDAAPVAAYRLNRMRSEARSESFPSTRKILQVVLNR